MLTRTAPQRAIDFYIASLQGFVLVDGPTGKVLLPPGMADDWEFRSNVALMDFVPHFTGDWSSGGPVIGEQDPSFLDRWMRDLVSLTFGEVLVDPLMIG